MATTPRPQTSALVSELLAIGVLRISADGTTILKPDGSAFTPAGGDVTSAQITDSTAVGRAVLTAASQAAARTAIGAGTSSLVLGTTAGTAKAGDYAPPNAAGATRGLVLQAAAVVDATDEATAVAQLNALLASLRTAGSLTP
ncbi:hypothetical protein D3C71_221660 [compost metagenome]